MLRNLWRWFWTNDWPSKPAPPPVLDPNRIPGCDLCAEPHIFVRCLDHKLDLCWHCFMFHNYKAACLYEPVMPIRNFEMRTYGSR
jgi:hypothetical protein